MFVACLSRMLSFYLYGREESDPIMGQAEEPLYHPSGLYACGGEGPESTGHLRLNGIYVMHIHGEE